MPSLSARQLSLSYDTVRIINALDVELLAGKITALVGPNGCGKSTLLRGLARLLKPKGGAVYLDGKILAELPTREIARQLGLLPQSSVPPEGITVRELVAQGRYPHQRWFDQWSPEDEAQVARALERTELTALADRAVDTLSGGQRQRAWIAMTLAQDTEILLLDEPTTFLDLAHQVEVLDLLSVLNEEGKTIVMVLHDLNQAARYAHQLVALHKGKIFATGEPRTVLTEMLVRHVFGVECCIVPHPVTQAPLVVPLGRLHFKNGNGHGDSIE
jgi:iron complex transport system ATP-binding protein